MGREESRARFYAECEGAPFAVWAFPREDGPSWNVIATVFGLSGPRAERMLLLTTEPPPRAGTGPIWLTPERARRMMINLLRALHADDGGAEWLMVAGIAFTVVEAEAIERVLAASLELIKGDGL